MKLLKISRWQQQSFKQSEGTFWVWDLLQMRRSPAHEASSLKLPVPAPDIAVLCDWK